MLNFSLKDKVTIITGASRGIGEAIATVFAENGAKCILVSRKQDSISKIAEKIKENGYFADAIACHIGYPEQIKELYSKIKHKYKRLDILVNNAATNPHFGGILDADQGVWDKIMDVNVKGPFFMTKYGVKLMLESGKGSVLNISSVNAEKPGLMQGVYSISKASLVSMTKVFAKELAPFNIRVNALLPGLTDTKFSKAIINNKEICDFVIKQIPMGRYAKPFEMVGAALYFVSDAASYTTGSCLCCDGGFLL
ncbi:MAG: short-chain dehydrogenase [Desulfobacteraceae bacterium 4572_130]|nr:MAG: short-chain dehydrogenase [Desulfobacteraceae bacterium 4572_130]